MTDPFAGRYDGLILASTSPARVALLKRFGVPFTQEAPGVDEDVPPGLALNQAVAMLAERKARAVAKRHPQSLVLGADQLVGLGAQAFGKAKDAKEARAQLSTLRGKRHDIFTAVTVVGPGFFECDVATAHLQMRALDDAELDAYVQTGEWHGCAGCYRVESRGIALFDAIDGDLTGIQGLPLLVVSRLLREAGVALLS